MKQVVAGLLMPAVTGMLARRADADVCGVEALQAKEGEADGSGKKKRVRDAQITQLLIAAYLGSCPCPHSTMSNGRKCGRRSAYSRPGGEAPLCYAKDVTAEMLREFRAEREAP